MSTAATAQTDATASSPLGMREYFTRMYEYEKWANAQALIRIAEIQPLPKETLHRMSHIVVCQGLWLSRMQGRGNSVTNAFPKWSLQETQPTQQANAQAMLDFVAQLPVEKLTQPFHYEALDGGKHSNLHYEILTQLLLHGSYHRGQVGVDVNRLSGKPLDLDFVYFARLAR